MQSAERHQLELLHKHDGVLVRNLILSGITGKLQNHWEDCIYNVGTAMASTVLHCNLLLPCDNLLLGTQLTPTTIATQEDEESNDDNNYEYHCVQISLYLCCNLPT